MLPQGSTFAFHHRRLKAIVRQDGARAQAAIQELGEAATGDMLGKRVRGRASGRTNTGACRSSSSASWSQSMSS